MTVTESFNYLDYSTDSSFWGDTTGRIELAGYPSNLVLATSFDSDVDGDYAISTVTAVTGDTESIENFGVFGQHVLISNGGYVRYDISNFESMTTEGSVKFRMRPNFNNDGGYQEFTATTSPSVGDTWYGFQLTVAGSLFGDTQVLLVTGDTMSDISDKINVAATGSDATATVTGSGNIRITCDTLGDSILIEEPTSGNSLITLLTSVGTAVIPNAPVTDAEILSFYNGVDDSNRISLIHDTSSHIILRMYDSAGDTQVNQDLGLWSNYYLNWYAFELDWNESLAQLFIDGTQFGVTSTGFSRGDSAYLFLQSNVGDTYRYDELLVYNEYQNNGAYTVETVAMQKYDDTDPYVDIHFGTGFVDGEVVDLNLYAHPDTHYTVKIGATWYYYLSGAWRVSDGTYSQTVTPGILETQFAGLAFNTDADLIIRAYFSSDGQELIWLDDISIVIETGAAETAIAVGTIDLTTAVNLSVNYNLVIATGDTSQTVNLKTGAGDTTAVTLAEIKTAIDGDSISGLAPAGDDGSGHLVLQSTATGTSAYIAVSSGATFDALGTVWGYAATDAGAEATGSTVDYSELFRYIRAKLGEPLIPAEITDEQLEDCLADAIYQYNRRKNFQENILYTNLTGTFQNGWDIPATVGGADNIIEIIMRPRFPFSYYAGRTDLITNLYVSYLFQRYKSGFSQMLTDYYVTITTEEDINVILGTQIKWEILNGKLWIWPEPDSMNIAIRYRGTLTAEEIVNDYWIRHLTLAEAKIVLGNIRSTFKSGIPGGAEMLQLNGEDLKQEGFAEREKILETMTKNQEPLFLEFF
jgi:hypothetical protein